MSDRLIEAAWRCLWTLASDHAGLPMRCADHLIKVFGVGRTHATRLVIQLERAGVVSRANEHGGRTVKEYREDNNLIPVMTTGCTAKFSAETVTDDCPGSDPMAYYHVQVGGATFTAVDLLEKDEQYGAQLAERFNEIEALTELRGLCTRLTMRGGDFVGLFNVGQRRERRRGKTAVELLDKVKRAKGY